MHVSSSAKFWEEKNRQFFAKYTAIDRTHKEWSERVVAGKPLLGPLGRSWTIPMTRDYKGELKIPINTLTNYPVQGTGADVMMLARLMAYKRIKKLGITCDFVSTVHDSIVVDTYERHLMLVKDVFDQVFADLPDQIYKLFGYKWTVPMECESKYGPNMKDMKEFT